jgi:hypothetical protein
MPTMVSMAVWRKTGNTSGSDQYHLGQAQTIGILSPGIWVVGVAMLTAGEQTIWLLHDI